MSAPALRLSVVQAQRAVAMKNTVGQDYVQPAHAWLAEKLGEARLVDGSSLSSEQIESLSRQVVLPGARRAVHLDALEQMRREGLDERQIVTRINEIADAALAPRKRQFHDWRDGPHAEHVKRAQERFARKQQLLQARAAEIELQLDKELGV